MLEAHPWLRPPIRINLDFFKYRVSPMSPYNIGRERKRLDPFVLGSINLGKIPSFVER